MGVVPFEIETQALGDGLQMLSVRGELDLDTAPKLKRELESLDASEVTGLLVDLSQCDFIDSTGVALLVKAWKRLDIVAAAGGRGRVVLCSPTAQVQRVLEITGLESSISVHPSRDAAENELRTALDSSVN
jgi:anti-sigma B factor antagonist